MVARMRRLPTLTPRGVARRLRPGALVEAASRTVLRRGVINRGGRGVVNLIDVGSAGGLPPEPVNPNETV